MGYLFDTEELAAEIAAEDAKSGDTIHILMEAKDSGAHHLRCYQRVIVTVE